MVVLSACETALGILNRGDGLIGISRRFLTAGTPRLVCTLWKVPDDSTSKLFIEFYKNLKTMNTAEALRKAQLSVIKRNSHPLFWAGPVLIGNNK